MRPPASTAAASVKTSPAPPTARLPKWTRCQSLLNPSSLEYWHMGETKTRLGTVTPDNWMGENKSDLDKESPLGIRCSAPREVAVLKAAGVADFSGTWEGRRPYITGRKKIM